MQMTLKKETGMLEGSLWDKILLFALPLAASSILQQLFNAMDVAVVGRFAGSEALAAVGANGPVINLIVGLFVGISVGTNAVIAILIGQGNERDIRKTVHTSILAAVVAGVALAAVGVRFAEPVLRLMSTPEDILELAIDYLQIYFLGMPSILLYNFAAAILRSRGDTRRPLLALTVSGVINVILNLFFVLICHMNVEGVAIATTVSNTVSACFLVYFLWKETGVLHLDFRKLRIDRDILGRIAKTGIPAGLQGVVFSISNVCIQAALNGLGAVPIAATAAALNFEYFAYYLISSFGQAGVTFIGQNRGAGNWSRCIRTVRWCLVLGGITALAVNGVFLGFCRPLTGFFTPDPLVAELAILRMRYILSFELINMVIEVLSGCMRGFGYSMAPALVCMTGICGLRMIWLYTVFPYSRAYTTLLVIYPVSWALTAVLLAITYFVVRKRAQSVFI